MCRYFGVDRIVDTSGRASLVAGVSRVGRASRVGGSWCKSTSKFMYDRSNRRLKPTWALALRNRADNQGNRLLKLARALALRNRADNRGNSLLKLARALALRNRADDIGR